MVVEEEHNQLDCILCARMVLVTGDIEPMYSWGGGRSDRSSLFY
jgi:hypothetical protein